jgi:hypothetical protein
LPDLIDQIQEYEVLVSVHGDGAYHTKDCYAAIAQRNAAAIISIRKNGQLWKENTSGERARNKAFCATKYLG